MAGGRLSWKDGVYPAPAWVFTDLLLLHPGISSHPPNGIDVEWLGFVVCTRAVHGASPAPTASPGSMWLRARQALVYLAETAHRAGMRGAK